MNPSLKIRTYQDRDKPEVVELWLDALPSPKPWNEPHTAIARKTAVADGLFFVGEHDGRIVATTSAGYDGVRGWIYAVAVAADYRKRGFGRQMVEHAERVLTSRGCQKLNLQVRCSNREVIAFYEGLNYATDDCISMGKQLAVTTELPALDPVPTIEVGDGIELTEFRAADTPRLVELLNATDQFCRFMWLIPYPYTEQDAEHWLNLTRSQTLETDGTRNWVIRDNTGTPIGGIGLKDLSLGQRAEVGYWLAKSHWGKGIMPRVLRRVVEYAFDAYRIVKLSAKVLEGNSQSQRVLHKIGFVTEGTFRDHEFRDGKSYDLHFYGLRKAEYARTN